MDPTIIVPVASLIAGGSTAVGVTYLTFAHNRKLERMKFLIAERARLYVDALAEAHTEVTWSKDRVVTRLYGADEQSRPAPDTRLPADERARLGARMVAYADPEVRRAWNTVNTVAARHSVTARSEEAFADMQVETDKAIRDLEAAVREALDRT